MPVGSSHLTGSRTTPSSSGIVGAGGWSDSSGGIKVAWSISFQGSYWLYSYSIKNKDGTALSPALSHLLLEVSPVITAANVATYIYDTNFTFEGPTVWVKDPNYPNTNNPGHNNGNPNLPVNFYGLRIQTSQTTYTFKSSQAPMWGDWYSKNGKTSGTITTAWTSAIGTEPAVSATIFTGWIPVPDTVGVEQCADGTDNDGDGLADCADPDCEGDPCQQNGSFCDGEERCDGGACEPSGNPCPDQCNESNDSCVECLTNGDCSDSVFCTGEEKCTAGVCEPGNDPCPGEVCDEAGPACVECLDNADCAGGDFCAPATKTCVDCLTNGDCDDSQFCSGEETCSGGTCLPGSDPCVGELCDEVSAACVGCLTNGDCDDALFCSGEETCNQGTCEPGSDPCVGELCDEANTQCVECLTNGDCDDALFCSGEETCNQGTCQPGSDPCPGTEVCDETDAACVECLVDTDCSAGRFCALPAKTCVDCLDNADCDDLLYCTGEETCITGTCQPGSTPCPSQLCNEGTQACVSCQTNADCDDSLYCSGQETCTAGACDPGDDPCPGQVCDEAGQACANCLTNADCDDPIACTVDECSNADCTNTPSDALCPSDTCSAGDCDLGSAGCISLPINEDGACDDGNVCTVEDRCASGECVGTGDPCGDGTVQGTCGEECDPPNTTVCDESCHYRELCVGPIAVPGIDCNAPNAPESACDPCQLICFPGSQPAIRFSAKRIAFVSDEDYTGENGDQNPEIFIFDLGNFKSRVRKGTPQTQALLDSVVQVTDTSTAGGGGEAVNEKPSLNGSGRYLAFASTADAAGDGLSDDGNKEIFQYKVVVTKSPADRQKIAREIKERLRITGTSGGDNLHPNLRGARGNLLLFDSALNLVPEHCSGGALDHRSCVSDADCPGGTCGNVEGNREIYLWNRRQYRNGGLDLTQLTTAPDGDSVIGNSVGSKGRSAAFSSDADLTGNNGEGVRQIFSAIKTSAKLFQVTQVTGADNGPNGSTDPSQTQGSIVAFASDADFGVNGAHRSDVFLWRKRGAPQVLQVTNAPGASCASGLPAIDSSSRFVAFESTCDVLPAASNPGKSIFVYDVKRDGFLEFTVRTPGEDDASRPLVTKGAARVVFELVPEGASEAESVCVFEAQKEHLSHFVPR